MNFASHCIFVYGLFYLRTFPAYVLDNLIIFLIHFITILYTQSVFKSKAFQELSEDALSEILKVDGLNMDEAEIIKYIKEWTAVNSVCITTKNVRLHKTYLATSHVCSDYSETSHSDLFNIDTS